MDPCIAGVIVFFGAELPLDRDAARIGEPRGEVGEIPLHDAEFQLVVGADILSLAEGGDPVGKGHAVGEVVQQLPLLAVDEGDIAVDQGVPRRPVRDDLLVGDDVGGVVRGAEGFLALQIPCDEHTGGQLALSISLWLIRQSPT